MGNYTIDIELEHYYGDRMGMSNREACRRFYLRAVARFHGQELEHYLHRVKSHASVYASLNGMLQSPFMHVETPLFLSSLLLCIAGIVMAMTAGMSFIVAGSTSAGLVGMIRCARKLTGLWQQYGVREAIFRELAETLQETPPL